MIKDFAVYTKFSISGCVVTLRLRGPVVVVAPVVVLTSGLIPSVVAAVLLLLLALWLESSDIWVRIGGLVDLLFFDCMHRECSRLTLVLFNSVLREEGLVGFVHRESGLIFVREQFANIFWSSSLENLCEQKLVVSFDRIICILRMLVL